MKKVIRIGEVLYNNPLADNIYDMLISVKDIADIAKPGQFVNVYLDDSSTILPRPISIAGIDKDNGTIRLIFAVVGKGTKDLSNFSTGESIKVMGPLGHGFEINPNHTNHIVIAGGIGTPPMLELCKHLNGKVTAFLGFRTNPILIDEFEKLGVRVNIATDDGSVGFKGNNIALITKLNPTADMIYSCGPKVMLRAAHNFATSKNIPLQVSMEERMACGIGVCVGCVCKTKDSNGNVEHSKVCTNGPVFYSSEVAWDE